MSGVPIGSNIIGYSSESFSLTPYSNEPFLTTRTLQFGITGAFYEGVSGSTSIIASTTNATTAGPKLYLRNMNDPESTANDVMILTDLNGNGNVVFTINKSDVINPGLTGPYALLYSRNLISYESGDDHTIPLYVSFPPLPPDTDPGSIFSVQNQLLTKTGVTTATLDLSKIYYNGSTATSGIIAAYLNGSNVSLTGTTGSVSGTLVGTSNQIFTSSNGNTQIQLTHNTVFDTSLPNNYYMIYYPGTSGLSGGSSYNYVGITGADLPFTVNNIKYDTSDSGVTATLYNLSYDFVGLTAGDQLMITNNQNNTSSIVNVQVLNDIPYATYFFGPTGISGIAGLTSIVLSGSKAKYYNGTTSSKSSYNIPSHLAGSEGITGKLQSSNLIFSNKKVTASLQGFDYFSSGGDSIFNSFNSSGNTGIIYLVSSDGYTGTVYSGSTGVPFIGSTAGIPYPSSSSLYVEFPTGLTNGPETKVYTASFYDSKLGTLRKATTPITYNWPGRFSTNDNFFVNNISANYNGGSLSLQLSAIDYYNGYGDSILAGGATGVITIKNQTTNTTLGVFMYNGIYDPLGQTQNYSASFPDTNVVLNTANVYTLSFSSGGVLRPATKVFAVQANSESLVGTVMLNDPSIAAVVLSGFDYLDSDGNSIFYGGTASGITGITGTTGYVQIFDPVGTLLQVIPSVLDRSYNYRFEIPAPTGASGPVPFNGYSFRFFDSTKNYLRPSIKYIMASGVTGFVDPSSNSGFASDWLGSSGANHPANFIFPYEFQASAAEIIEILLLGELDFGPSGGVLQTVTMSVPQSELDRMFVYTTGWANGMTGIGGGIGISGVSGMQAGTMLQNAMFPQGGPNGPNSALLLQYVLSALNVTSGFTGASGLFNVSDRLAGLDYVYETATATTPQDGVTATGNPWTKLFGGQGPAGGSTGIAGYPVQGNGYFLDDAGVTCAQMGLISAQNVGATSYAYDPNSLLNNIPIEAVASLTKLPPTVQKFKGITGIFKDIDTRDPTFRAPLVNLFEQAVAFQRVDDAVPLTVSNMGPNLSGIGPWTTASTIYGVNFREGDTLSLFIQYQFGQVRRYGIDPTVVQGLGSRFQSAPVYSITFAGRTFNIPIGNSDPNPSVYPNGYNMGTSQNLAWENSLTNTSASVEIRLVATASNVQSSFDY